MASLNLGCFFMNHVLNAEKAPNYPFRRAVVAATLAGVAVLGAIGLNKANNEPKLGDSSVTVERGDTLWGVAREHCQKMSTDEAVFYLRELNDIEDPGLMQPGDEIVLLNTCE